jgi:hypothetical protein
MQLVLFLIASALLSACGAAASAGAGEAKKEPYHLDGTNLILTEQAVKRLDVQTAPLREEQVTRMLHTWGEVLALSGSAVGVRVRLHEGDLNRVDRDQPAAVMLAGGGSAIQTGRPQLQNSGTNGGAASAALVYAVESANHGLTKGQYVRVDIAMAGGAVQRKVVPYSAVLYDVHGDAWVYTSAEALTYTRQKVVLDYIDGDMAYLTEGPPAGTSVVTVGVSELFGAESGVGH